MTDPADEDLLRGMAARYLDTDQAFAARLYAEADYLAQLHRDERVETAIREPDIVIDQTCPMIVNWEVQSLGAGDTVRQGVCGLPTTAVVEWQGLLYGACPQCAEQVEQKGGRKVSDR